MESPQLQVDFQGLRQMERTVLGFQGDPVMAATSRERESALLSALTLVERARALSGQAILVRRPSKLPWNIIELLTSSRDEAGFNATQVPPGRPSPVQLSWGAVPFQGKAQIPAQVWCIFGLKNDLLVALIKA